MNSNVLVVKSSELTEQLQGHLERSMAGRNYEVCHESSVLTDRHILFVIELNGLGYDLKLLEWLENVRKKGLDFKGSVGALIIRSCSELYTKSFAQDIILHTNALGLSFIGHSVIEIIKDYSNFLTWQKTQKVSLKEICETQCKALLARLLKNEQKASHKILALHASSYKTSNTLGLWHLVKKDLIKLNIHPQEIHIENGTVVDCKGCSFSTCMHFGREHSCFYGGIMVKEVLPAIELADVIVWVCPNYNDAISANLLAVINRLTVLYRQISFHDKVFYAVVVSGNSGSDSVAKQLIGALNINKGFKLPPYFSIMAVANEPMKVLEIDGIRLRSKEMAEKINDFCQYNQRID